MKFKVTDDCTNCSYCYTQYPDKFEISEDGSKSVPIDGIDIDEDEANEIANECPMMAIKVIK